MPLSNLLVHSQPVVSSSLPTLRLDRLEAKDETESGTLLQACTSHGFFYLDLSSVPQLLVTWRELLNVLEEYFAQPIDVKMQDSRNQDSQGYEPMGTVAGADLNRVDAYEAIKISRGELLNNNLELTTSIKERSELFIRYAKEAHRITIMILQRLSDALGLKGSERFEYYHRDDMPSLSTLGMMKYPKHEDILSNGVGHHHHTDLGTLTFLLSEQWGLQIIDPDKKGEGWAFVEPRVNHAVVNVGDTLRFMSGNKLASVVHRVKPVREKQHEDRYSIAYFLRMEDGANINYTDGTRTWSAKEWHDHKFDSFRNPLDLPDGIRTLTGYMV